MAHAGVKNAYRATIHTWRWAWHLKPCVVRHLSTALSTSVTTNSLKLIMNDPFREFVQLHSAEYRAYAHRKRWLMLCFKSLLFRIVISKNETGRKALQCIIKGKIHDEQISDLKHFVALMAMWGKPCWNLCFHKCSGLNTPKLNIL